MLKTFVCIDKHTTLQRAEEGFHVEHVCSMNPAWILPPHQKKLREKPGSLESPSHTHWRGRSRLSTANTSERKWGP